MLAYRSSSFLSPTLPTKTCADGVVNGPFSATLLRLIDSIVASGRGVPFSIAGAPDCDFPLDVDVERFETPYEVRQIPGRCRRPE